MSTSANVNLIQITLCQNNQAPPRITFDHVSTHPDSTNLTQKINQYTALWWGSYSLTYLTECIWKCFETVKCCKNAVMMRTMSVSGGSKQNWVGGGEPRVWPSKADRMVQSWPWSWWPWISMEWGSRGYQCHGKEEATPQLTEESDTERREIEKGPASLTTTKCHWQRWECWWKQ